VVDAIAQSKDRLLDRLLGGLGIRHVGSRVAFVLAEHFGDLAELSKATVEQLSSIHEIGDVIAQSVYDFFHSEAGKHTITELKKVGMDPKMKKRAVSAKQPLAGMTVVVTGTLKRFKREEIERMIGELGGRSAGSVSKKTSFLVAGEEAGSKLDKAKELGVEVLTEEEFVRRVGL
jgi:DNA ligase (NAD+)